MIYHLECVHETLMRLTAWFVLLEGNNQHFPDASNYESDFARGLGVHMSLKVMFSLGFLQEYTCIKHEQNGVLS